MADTAQAITQEKPAEKEADHHPYYRPKDAATLILVDRSGDVPKVLVGKRHDKVVFMPGTFVFPGGCLRHHPSRRGRDPCRSRTRRTGLGRDRLATPRRPASHDQERAGCPGKAAGLGTAAPRRSRAVLSFLRRQDAE